MKPLLALIALSSLSACDGVWTDPSTGCRYLRQYNGRGWSYTVRFKADGKPDCPGVDRGATENIPPQD